MHFHSTTIAYWRKRYIARLHAFASHNGRFRTCEFRTNNSNRRFFSATVYDPNLNLLIARIFCCFCFCANCEIVLLFTCVSTIKNLEMHTKMYMYMKWKKNPTSTKLKLLYFIYTNIYNCIRLFNVIPKMYIISL